MDCIEVRSQDANHTSQVGQAFKEFTSSDQTGEMGMGATMIVVPGGFVDKDMMVEIEADAVV
jgi:hypothetical protein